MELWKGRFWLVLQLGGSEPDLLLTISVEEGLLYENLEKKTSAPALRSTMHI